MSELMFPKGSQKKKRKAHQKSIMHRKEEGTCYLCKVLEDDWTQHKDLEEHHVIFSKHQRQLAEEYGLKVYLCRRHHQDGPEAVHENQEHRRLLEAAGQQAFEELYSRERWMEIFGQNYL